MPLQPPSITRLILHCSASPNGRDDRAADIDRWHRERGFRRDPALIQHDNPTLRHIGYHYVIDVYAGLALAFVMTRVAPRLRHD